MIGALLRLLGVVEALPKPNHAPVTPYTDSEARYECARQDAERVIEVADRETDVSQQKLVSWEGLYKDPRRTP